MVTIFMDATPKNFVSSVDLKLYTIYELDWNFAINRGSAMMKLFVYIFSLKPADVVPL